MSSSLEVYVGTFIKVDTPTIELKVSKNVCEKCGDELHTPFCPICGGKSIVKTSTDNEEMDMWEFLEEHGLDGDYMWESDTEEETGGYILSCDDDVVLRLDSDSASEGVRPLPKKATKADLNDVCSQLDEAHIKYSLYYGALTTWN